MKKIIAAILCLMMILSVAACGGKTTVSQDATPAEQAKAWINDQIKNNTLFSFTYDGVAYEEHIKDWKKTVDETEDGWDLKYVSKDGVEFTVDVTFHEEHAAIDWVGSFHHTGSSDSKVIGEVMILDADFGIKDAIMTTCNSGGEIDIDDYQAYETDLVELGTFQVKNTGGRSSQGAFPWFDVTSGDNTYGIMGAIGWTGDWQATFDYAEGVTTVACGMQRTNYFMKADETFRTPSMVIQFFKGTQNQGHNDWRALILDKYNPKTPDGETVTHAPITINTWGGRGSKALCSQMQQAVNSGQYFEYQWIDAGWYGDYISDNTYEPEWSTQLGNWYYNPGYDGVGFKAIADQAEKYGYGVLVWFEPGRALGHSDLYKEHPEFFLPQNTNNITSTTSFFTDYGNPDALKYITDMVLGFLDDMRVDFYRQDYNFNPAEGWARKDRQENSDGERVGVAEINYVTGHYAFLDAILASGRQIDNCASGGRLIDIEMTKRAIPLWRTDYTVSGQDVETVASGIYSQGAGISWWVVHSGGMGSKEGNSTEYGFRAYMASGATMGTFSDQGFAKKMIDEMLHNREYMLHDFYILQQGYGADTNNKNAGYEYYIPEQGRGYLVCFRPSGSGTEYTNFYLEGLEAEATYVVRNADTEETHEFTGEQLMTNGLKVYFPRTMVSHMIYFDKK